MITRRTLRRTHLLRPDPALSALFRYCLAEAAMRHGIEVHAAVLMSTHLHLIVTDRDGRLPPFLRDLHRHMALGVKVLRKWEGAVWDHEATSVVELKTPAAVIEKLAYLMANPVAAGLVRHASDWPGLMTLPSHLGQARWPCGRPDVYFRPHDQRWPPELTLQFTPPPGLDMTDEELRARVADELRQAEQRAFAEVRSRGWSILGAKRALRLSPYGRARSWEPLRSRSPTFAVGRGNVEAYRAAIATLRYFRAAYREALERWRQGIRDVLFPYGTWELQWWHHVAVALPNA